MKNLRAAGPAHAVDGKDEIAARTKRYWLQRKDKPRHLVELRTDGTTTDASGWTRHWFKSGDGARKELLLADGTAVKAMFREHEGVWEGCEPAVPASASVALTPARGEELADMLHSLVPGAGRGLILASSAAGMDSRILLEANDDLILYVLVNCDNRLEQADAEEDVVENTRVYESRRFILTHENPLIALSVVDDASLEWVACIGEAHRSELLVRACTKKVRRGGAIIWAATSADENTQIAETLSEVANGGDAKVRKRGPFQYSIVDEPPARSRSCGKSSLPAFVSEHNAASIAKTFLRSIEKDSKSPGSGRGIVICGGGRRYFPCAWVCIKMLRYFGCKLPIELWGLNADEVNSDIQDLVSPLGVRCVDASQVRRLHPVRSLGGWELKPFALLHCGFREALLLDADNVPVADPTYLFDSPGFATHGAVFWPDYGRLAKQRSIWKICRLKYRDEPEFESGQILIDKTECYREIQLTMHLNEYSDFYYKYVHGDKETFHLAWRMAGSEYAMIPWPIHTLQHVMCQHDFDGKRIFQHRNLAKWTLAEENERIRDFWYERECLDALQELRSRWSGGTHGQGRTAAEAEAYQEVLAQGYFRYHRIGYDVRGMELLPGGKIGRGQAACEEEWYVRENSCGVVHLGIVGRGNLTCRLRKGSDNLWRGRWLIGEGMGVTLQSAENMNSDPNW